MIGRCVVNAGRGDLPPSWDGGPTRRPLELHGQLPGYGPTPLMEAPVLAETLGVGQVLLKDETNRMELPSFKILGASWALYQAVGRRLTAARNGVQPDSVHELRARLRALGSLRLVTATDGNHGRAVAHLGRLLDLDVLIFVPSGTSLERIAAMESEGATVEMVAADYDSAVRAAEHSADDRSLLIADTAWEDGYGSPRWVIEGYSTLFFEIDDELRARGQELPIVVMVPMGVGALAAAAIRHFGRSGPGVQPMVVGVEPLTAACIMSSLEAGHPVTVPGPHDSLMAGLNCGTPSPIAWPIVSAGLSGAVAIDDDRTCEAMALLDQVGLKAGETGAASVGGALELARNPEAGHLRQLLGWGPQARLLLLCTEGVTDHVAAAAALDRGRVLLGIHRPGVSPVSLT